MKLTDKKETIICSKHGAVEVGFYWNGAKNEFIARTCPHCIAEAEEERNLLQDEERKKLDAEAKKRKFERAIRQANIPERFVDRKLDNYMVVNERAAKALKIARAYGERFEEVLKKGTSLCFLGNVGNGKTHLAVAIAHELMAKGYYPLFLTVSKAVRHVKGTWAKDSELTESDAIRNLVEPDLLILDEVGVQFGSDAEKLILFEVLNDRYEANKPTIVMSNLAKPEFDKYLGTRVVDRLKEGGGCDVVFDWESYRA